MKFRSAFLLILAGYSFISGAAQSAHSAHRLRVGTYQLNAETKLVLLGIKLPQDHPVKGLNLEELQFQGEDLNQIDPKFLLEVTRKGITRVRSFELGIADQQTEELPPILIEVDKAREKENLHVAGNVLAATFKTLGPLGLPAIGIQTWTKHYENLRKFQAYYLMELIDKTLPDSSDSGKFPELLAALSPHPTLGLDWAETALKTLGGALLTRYNPHSNWQGIHIGQVEPSFAFDQWRLLQVGKRSENRSYLNERMGEVKLDPIYFGEDFALVFVDSEKREILPGKKHYQSELIGLGSAKKGPRDIIDFVKSDKTVRLNQEQGSMIPWYAVSFVNADGPVDLANFAFPGKFGKKLRQMALHQVSRELVGSLFGLYWPVKWANSWYQEAKLEKYDTRYLKRLQSYGAVLALTQTHAHNPIPLNGVNPRLLQRALDPFQVQMNLSSKSQSELLNEAVSLLVAEEAKMGQIFSTPSQETLYQTKQSYLNRLKNYIRKNTPALKLSLRQSTGVNRSPCGAKPTPVATVIPDSKPVILFLVDGMRPDRFRLAANQGLMPRTKALFLDRGIHANSFTTRSLTFPSWSTILRGVEPDFHGIRSNTPTSRIKHEVTDNYQDARQDLLFIKNWVHTRAYQRLEEDKAGPWLPAYFNRDEAIYNFLPTVSNANSAAAGVIEDFLKESEQWFGGIKYLASVLDSASAESTSKLIREATKKKRPLKFVMNWYAAVDEASHYNNKFLKKVYKDIDNNIAQVLDAAADHPDLKNATVFLISDHGHTGGYGPFDETSTIYQSKTEYRRVTDGPLLAHAGLNLTKLFAGKYIEYPQYNFVVGAADSPAPKFELRVLEEYMLQPFKYTYPRHSGPPNLLVDCSGDNMAQVYVKGNENWNRLNFYELSHFQKQEGAKIINFPFELLNLKLESTVITDSNLLAEIRRKTDLRPVELFVMPLKDKEAHESINQLIQQYEPNGGLTITKGEPKNGFKEREPVLVVARGQANTYKTSLILTRSDRLGHDEFRYVVVRNFSQSKSGRVTATISTDAIDDPLNYIDQVPGAHLFTQWRSDREWLDLAQRHSKPTAIFAIPRFATLAPKYTDPEAHELSESVKEARKGEIPDFFLLSNPGFAFHSDAPLQSDHGGLAREEVLNTFFIGSLEPKKFSGHFEPRNPILNRDFMPTILEYAGMDTLYLPVQGISAKSTFDQLQGN